MSDGVVSLDCFAFTTHFDSPFAFDARAVFFAAILAAIYE